MSKHDGHDYHGPTDHKNSSESDSCQLCMLAATYCKTCHGGEASLPKECPGRAMTQAEHDAVQAGTLNYKDGKWWFAADYHKGKDRVVEGVKADLEARSALGIRKYGLTLDMNPDDLRQRLQHFYEELLDAANYAKWNMMKLDGDL